MEIVLYSYDHLASTNEEAQRLISCGKAKEGMVISAREQSKGRGAGDNLWESKQGKNLTFSLILQPRFLEPSRQFVLTQMISLALFDVAARHLMGGYLCIKWPNDLYFNEKKLAGVLVQNRIKANLLDFSVIGVGFNVNQKKFYSHASNPVSIILFSNKEESLSDLLEEILKRVNFYYEKIKNNIKSLEDLYLQRLYRMGEWADYEDETGHFTAKIIGIDRYGLLLMTDRKGQQRTYGFKEVKFL